MRKIIIPCLLLLVPVSASAYDNVLADCAQATVQAALDAAADNDTVTCPAGSWDWGNTQTTINAKAVTLQGAGYSGADNTTITVNWWANLTPPLKIVTSGDKFVRVTGFYFVMGTDSGSGLGNMIEVGTNNNSSSFRIDGNRIDLKRRGIVTSGVVGLIDNNMFYGAATGSPQGIGVFGQSTTGGDDSNPGGLEWTSGTSLGTDNAVYIDNNTFTWVTHVDSVINAYQGARFVFRYNHVINNQVWWHGTDSGNYHSPHSFEIYNNTFDGVSGSIAYPIGGRGGTGVIYNNTAGTGYSNFAAFANYRSCTGHTSVNTGVWGWCDGANGIDENSDANGYACRDQIGTTGPRTDNVQVHQPVYMWNNTLDGSAGTGINSGICAAETAVIQVNRDWYNATEMPGYAAYDYPHPLTGAIDDIVNPPSFTNVTGVALSTETTTSPCATVAGIDAGQTPAITISGTGCTYNVDGAAYTANAGTVGLDNVVCLRGTSSGSYSTTYPSCTLTIGGVNNTGAPWTVRTLAAVLDPVAPRMRAGSMSGGWR